LGHFIFMVGGHNIIHSDFSDLATCHVNTFMDRRVIKHLTALIEYDHQ